MSVPLISLLFTICPSAGFFLSKGVFSASAGPSGFCRDSGSDDFVITHMDTNFTDFQTLNWAPDIVEVFFVVKLKINVDNLYFSVFVGVF